MIAARAAAILFVSLSALACTSAKAPPSAPSVSTITQTIVQTRTASPPSTFTPAPGASVRPVPYGQKPPNGEKARFCPYIRTGLDQQSNSGANVADIEGDRIYLTTVLTKYHPVGCRFYFYAGPYEAVADIRPMTFPSDAAAYAAMIRIADAGREQIPEKNFSANLTGICYRTKYFGPDGPNDWAFVFAKGRVVVDVLTQRNDTSRNALYLAQAIAAKF